MDRYDLLNYARSMEALAKRQAELMDQLFEEIQELEQAYSDELNGRPYLFRSELLEKAQKLKAIYLEQKQELAKQLED